MGAAMAPLGGNVAWRYPLISTAVTIPPFPLGVASASGSVKDKLSLYPSAAGCDEPAMASVDT